MPKGEITIEAYAFNNNCITSVNEIDTNGLIYKINNDGTLDFSKIISYGGESKNIDFIPSGVTTIGKYAFANSNLLSITLPESVIAIEEAAFEENNLTSAVFPKNIKKLGKLAFNSNKLSDVILPDSLTSIGFDAFIRNGNLNEIILPGEKGEKWIDKYGKTHLSGDRVTIINNSYDK